MLSSITATKHNPFYINVSATIWFSSNTYIVHGMSKCSRTVLDVLLVLFQYMLLHAHTEVDPVSCIIAPL